MSIKKDFNNEAVIEVMSKLNYILSITDDLDVDEAARECMDILTVEFTTNETLRMQVINGEV